MAQDGLLNLLDGSFKHHAWPLPINYADRPVPTLEGVENTPEIVRFGMALHPLKLHTVSCARAG